jgi:hypothetical protein
MTSESTRQVLHEAEEFTKANFEELAQECLELHGTGVCRANGKLRELKDMLTPVYRGLATRAATDIVADLAIKFIAYGTWRRAA